MPAAGCQGAKHSRRGRAGTRPARRAVRAAGGEARHLARDAALFDQLPRAAADFSARRRPARAPDPLQRLPNRLNQATEHGETPALRDHDGADARGLTVIVASFRLRTADRRRPRAPRRSASHSSIICDRQDHGNASACRANARTEFSRLSIVPNARLRASRCARHPSSIAVNTCSSGRSSDTPSSRTSPAAVRVVDAGERAGEQSSCTPAPWSFRERVIVAGQALELVDGEDDLVVGGGLLDVVRESERLLQLGAADSNSSRESCSAPCAYQVMDARRWLGPPVSRCLR